MAILSNHDAALIKLHLLSEGVSFTSTFLEQFADDNKHMEKRRVYNDSDERQLNRTQRIPQEFYLNNVIIAVNYKHDSPWELDYQQYSYRLRGPSHLDVAITFPKRPQFLDTVTPEGIRCDRIANLYGGSALAFFTPGSCSYFEDGNECRFCSLQPNRSTSHFFLHTISPSLARSVLAIALTTDAHVLKQIMVVGGNSRDDDQGFQHYLDIAAALVQQQALLPLKQQLETHISTMPPRDYGLFTALPSLNAHISLNIEVFDERRFETICPGKAHLYGRNNIMKALKQAAHLMNGKRVYSVLIAGLESVESTIAGIKYLVSIGVTPTVNVFHNDRGSHFEHHPRPSFEDLLKIAHVLQDVYEKYQLTPYWKGCGRNALDFEAQQGWFS